MISLPTPDSFETPANSARCSKRIWPAWSRPKSVLLDALEMIKDQNAIRELIANEESSQLEFKASLRWDYGEKRANKSLAKPVARTMAGFLNKDGGTLLIGISDEKEILGIQPDLETLSRPDEDGFQQAFRSAIKTYLGPEISPHVELSFVTVEGRLVACASCDKYAGPVYLRDGDRQEFCVRAGNTTEMLDARAAHEYILATWSSAEAGERIDHADYVGEGDVLDADQIRELVAQAVRQELAVAESTISEALEERPPWLRVGTRRVLDLFLSPLSRARKWSQLYIVSPWISEFGPGATITSEIFRRRIVADSTTIYLVTRPPEEDWHREAIERMAATRRVNVVYLPYLHVKLFCAETIEGSFALVGSSNFTQRSLDNRELGLLVDGYAEGRRVVRDLKHEAAEIYRTPNREIAYQAEFEHLHSDS